MRVMIQFRSTPTLSAAAKRSTLGPAVRAGAEGAISGLVLDPTFPAVPVPKPVALEPGANPFLLGQPRRFSTRPQDASYLMRGTIPDGDPNATYAMAARNPDVMGIFADPAIESCIICPGAPALGSDKDVAKLLSVGKLAAKGMDGKGVALAIVDTGINVAHLVSKGRKPVLDGTRSWTPAGVATKPGKHPVDHGTMCAYDAGIAAPGATLLDHAVLLSTTPGATAMSGLLSDAVLSYSKLLGLLTGALKGKPLVVSNSWGMFDPAWDFPVGHPGNYSDNATHPFNVIVSSLESAGADILFAAGNCGRNCPDGRCKFGPTRPICGANSHPAVLSVAGIDVGSKRVGYSSQGPGRLASRKPDISAYTHFAGSGVYPADGGTSAACPVGAGVVAAIRAKVPPTKLAPAALRSLIFKSARDLGGTGFDFDHGWGALDPGALLPLLP